MQQKKSSNYRGNNRSNYKKRRPSHNHRPRQKKPVKLSFWQKILALFKGGAASKPTKTKAKDHKKPVKKAVVNSNRIYVGNLSYECTETDLTDLFKGVGIVKKIEIIYNKHTHRSKGYGFVEMQTTEEAQHGVNILHNQHFMGRRLVLSEAKEPRERQKPQPTNHTNKAPSASEQANTTNASTVEAIEEQVFKLKP